MSLTNSPFWFSSGASAGGGAFYPYSIDQSLRFDGSSTYLNFTPASSTAGTFTVSFWVKRTKLGVAQYAYYSGAVNQRGGFGFDANDKFFVSPFNSSGANANLFSDMLFRDVGAWYHIVIEANAITYSNLSTAMNIYVNGQEITHTKTQLSTPSGGDRINDTQQKFIGALTPTPSSYFSGYLAEWNWIDGTALDATSFGETINGVWVSKEYTGSHGSAGYYLNFSDNSTASALGTDSSGNGNDFSVNNLATTDQVPDSPTNNFATMNALQLDTVTLQDGNLLVKANGTIGTAGSTVSVSSGKWYFEARNDGAGSATFERMVGIMTSDAVVTTTSYSDANKYVWWAQTGNLRNNSNVSYGDTWTADGDIIGIALDLDNNAMWFSKNGTWQASATQSEIEAGTTTNAAFTGLTGEYNFIISSGDTAGGSTNPLMQANFGQDSTFGGNISAGGNADASGLGDFAYTVPSGFNCLALANLPEPTISPNAEAQADDYFNTVLYTGDGTTGRSITGVNFSPNFVWTKGRSGARQHLLFDTIRGNGAYLLSAGTNAEATDTNTLTTFDSDGFTIGSNININNNTETYVAWNWKAGGTAVSNTDGSITSSVSANQDAGFSIVSYTGNGTAGATIGHGLSSVPEMIIVKNRDATDAWQVYHANNTANPETDYLVLNTTAATADNLDRWNDTAPTTSVFSIGDGVEVNTNTEDYIAYCFNSVDGFSKVGSYVGNGNANGTFIYTGFRPAFLLIKETGNANSWEIYDTARDPDNVASQRLFPNTNAAEATTNPSLDILSNGFKARAGNTGINRSNGNYIYLAFAEAPFKYSNAR